MRNWRHWFAWKEALRAVPVREYDDGVTKSEALRRLVKARPSRSTRLAHALYVRWLWFWERS